MTKAQKTMMLDALRGHLQSGSRAAIPAGGELLWQWFADLNGTRTWHAWGPNPISLSEIEAYARIHRWPLRADHVRTLQAMDEAYISHALAKRDAKQKNEAPTISSVQMTPGLFDAMFGGR